MLKILCVEDSLDVILILESTLKNYYLHFARTVEEAYSQIKVEKFSLIILDILLPDGDGFELLGSISDQLHDVPIFFLTCKKDFASKSSAFLLGADDYIVKPFDPKELKLRVDSKLRKSRLTHEEASSFKLGSLVCYFQEQRLCQIYNNKKIDLTSIEFRIFCLLAKSPNKIFSRELILDRVWGEQLSVTDRAVDVHISKIRKKLYGTDVTLESVSGVGYKASVISSM